MIKMDCFVLFKLSLCYLPNNCVIKILSHVFFAISYFIRIVYLMKFADVQWLHWMENNQMINKLSQGKLNWISKYFIIMAINGHVCMITSFYNLLMCDCIWESLNYFKMSYFWCAFPFTHITYNFCRLDLLPFYARLVATLHPCMSDVAEDLCSMLRGDFRFHVCI